MATSLNISKGVFLFIATFYALILGGQSADLGIPQTINFAKESYQAGTQNWCILQDDSGMMIFGNNKGLLLFDGTYWELLPLPNRTIVRSAAKAPDGRIFVGGQDEFGWLAHDGNNQIEYRSLTHLLSPEDRSFEDVWEIFPTEERTFFCTQRALFVYENGTFTVVKSQTRFQNFFFVNHQLYAQEWGRGLLKWKDGAFELIPGGDRFEEYRIAEILPFADKLLVISEFLGLFWLTDQGLEIWETEISPFLKTNQAYCAILLPEQQLAIGTAQDGLVVVDKYGKMLLHLNKTSGLQNNTVLSIALDRLDNYWLGLDNGIDYLQISMPFARIGDEIGLEGTGYAAALYEGKLYLGTNQGLFEIDWPLQYQNQLENRARKLNPLSGQVWGLNMLGDALIVNTHKGTFQVQDGKIFAISPPQGSWKITPLMASPELAIEGGYTGLSLYKKQTTEAGLVRWQYQHKIQGFEESARVMEQDAEGNIWVSHAYKGLFKIRLGEDQRKAEVRYFGEEDGLPGNIAINVLKVNEDILFSTLKGVYVYDPKLDRFFPQEAFNNILGGTREIHRLLQDETKKLWFSIENDFGCLDIKEQGFLERPEIENFFFNHLQDKLVDGFEEVYAIDEGHTIIGTEKGFSMYSPRQDSQRNLQLNVLLRRVVAIGDVDSLLYTENLLREDTLAANQALDSHLNALRFSFAAPFYEQIAQLEYRYWLKGYEDNWSAWSERTSKEYTNLASGEYEFRVQARNTYGTISGSAVYRFTILPPWYASTLARSIYLVLGLLVLGGVFFSFSKKLEKERLDFAQSQAKTIAQKEAQYQQEKEKSDEEIDRLRNEKLRSDIQYRTSQLASATMHLVQKGEVLVKIKKELAKVVKQTTTEENRKKLQKIINTIDGNIRLDSNWEQFEAHFDQVHGNFLRNLREAYPELTPKDQKLCAYLRMNLTTKEIAPLMNISVRGVEISRYRLRKKLNLDTHTNLSDFIMRF